MSEHDLRAYVWEVLGELVVGSEDNSPAEAILRAARREIERLQGRLNELLLGVGNKHPDEK